MIDCWDMDRRCFIKVEFRQRDSVLNSEDWVRTRRPAAAVGIGCGLRKFHEVKEKSHDAYLLGYDSDADDQLQLIGKKRNTHDRICLLLSRTENLLLARWTGRPSRPMTMSSGFITFKQSSEKRLEWSTMSMEICTQMSHRCHIDVT